MYKSQLENLKASLTDVPDKVYTKDWQPRASNIQQLDQYLSANDCTKEPDFKGCYREARLLLIATTKELDAANDQINGLNQVVDQLIGNVNAIIDNLNGKENSFDPKSLMKKAAQ